ncbi:hypothetical protein FSP39_016032 [Pinctada imbricata]|uniref:Uncharacterized protein n=1 Tax=Pinctada imbricata TaxID=66713 RepID=A0AA88XFX9_PINIB|nr:hypothetical protein FSP39_016032 [Pinctada imbricata]
MYQWDCGLACACMVLRYLGLDDRSVYTTDLEELQCGESIWTIDLAYLMRKHGIQVELATITVGVDKSYAKKSFYQDTFNKDEKRIENLFAEASSSNITVTNRSVKIEEIIQHISQGNLVISLVDWSYLHCVWCDGLVSIFISLIHIKTCAIYSDILAIFEK